MEKHNLLYGSPKSTAVPPRCLDAATGSGNQLATLPSSSPKSLHLVTCKTYLKTAISKRHPGLLQRFINLAFARAPVALHVSAGAFLRAAGAVCSPRALAFSSLPLAKAHGGLKAQDYLKLSPSQGRNSRLRPTAPLCLALGSQKGIELLIDISEN